MSGPIQVLLRHILARRIFLFFACLFLISGAGFSQQFNFTNYGVEEGLPQSTIYEIFQDNNGYLWLGTDGGGLCRYDGFRFKTYGKADGLNANVIKKIIQDKQNTIWIATNGGLYFLRNDKIESFKQINENKSIFFYSVFIDSKENIWAASTGKGIFKITPNGREYLVKNFTTSDGLSNDYIFDVCEDGKGRIWMAAIGEGLNIYDPKSNTLSALKQTQGELNDVISLKKSDENHLLVGTKSAGAYTIKTDDVSSVKFNLIPGTENNQVWSFAVDDEKNYWTATTNAGVVYSNGNLKLNMSEGLVTDKIFKVFIDREKNIWIGTDNAGLVKYSGSRFIHLTEKELPGFSSVCAIAKDKQQSYWIATSQNGIYNVKYSNNKVNILSHITSRYGLAEDEITGISISNDNTLWLATTKGVSRYNGQTFKNYTESDGLIGSTRVNCVFNDSKNRVWIGTNAGMSLMELSGKFINVSETNGLINNEVQCFLEDRNHNIWLGTYGGLVKIGDEKMYSFFEEDGLTEKKINSLVQDKKGNIYIGTFGGGVFKLDIDSKEKKIISPLCGEDKLSSNNIYSLTFQNDSTLLVGTNTGLNKINFDRSLKIKSITHLGRAEGFKNPENNLNAVLNDGDTSVWLGTPKGVTIYRPNYDKTNLVKPGISITSFKINGIDFPETNNLHLSHDQNSLKIAFVSISLSNPSANEYYAKLEGFDTTWNRLLIDKQNAEEFVSVEYKKLQPGTYELQLKSKNNDGVESETISVRFFIALPFYKTKWFIAGAVLFAFLLIYFFFKFRERKLIKEKEKLESIVTERTAQVEAQRSLLEVQKHEITDSINYSKRIQNAILPEQKLLFGKLPQSFILYRPKDIVSGDFYFFAEGNRPGSFYLAVADCTGHGVPGAFMSMIGSKELSEAVKTNFSPADILSALNVGVRNTLKQSNLEIGIKDGMDIGFLLLDIQPKRKEIKVSYAGANRPLWIVKKDGSEVLEIKATKTAIGGYTQDEQIFAQHELVAEEGDMLYLFSDGYADQFGGTSGKKMMTKRFKELLLESKNLSMQEQEKYLADYFTNWMGTTNEQVDDVLVIGVRV